MGKRALGRARWWAAALLMLACGGEVRPGPAQEVPAPPPTCQPLTCASAGATCGSVPDGCGATLDCGPCVSPDANACPAGDAAPGCAEVRAFRQAVRWVHQYGGPQRSLAADVAVLASGDILLASHVRGVGTVGGQSAGTPDEESTVLSRYDAAGHFQSERWIADFVQELALGVTADGGFTLVGNGLSSDVGGGPATATPRTLIAHFAPEGRWRTERVPEWSVEFSATDAEGNVVVVDLPPEMDAPPVYLRLYGADGRLRWERSVQSGDGDDDGLHGWFGLTAFAFTPDGHLLAAGSVHTSFLMDGQLHTFSQLRTPVLLKLDGRTGRLLWARGLDGASGSFNAVALTASGAIRLQGTLSGGSSARWGDALLEAPTPRNNENQRSVLRAADADGQPLWGLAREPPLGQHSLLTDGEEVLSARSASDGQGCVRTLLQRYSPDGELLWSRTPTRSCETSAHSIAFESMALLPNRDIVLTGTFRGRIDFGTGPLSSEGQNIVLMRMAP